MAPKPSAPLLSIVTINWNNATQLPRTLASLQQMQGDPRIELIFIDGASSDGSEALARPHYQPERFISEPDSGIYNAMNKGLALAQGHYVLWLNSGDELKDDVRALVLSALSNTEASMVSFALDVLDAEGNLLRTRTPHAALLPSDTLPHPSTCLRRQDVSALGGYDESFRVAADMDLIIRLYLASPTSVLYDARAIASFYSDGISSTADTFEEVLRVKRKNSLLGPWRYWYLLWRYRYKRLNRQLRGKYQA